MALSRSDMTPRYHIHYLRRREIDIARWDACMATASNRLIYGFSSYLDHMTGGQWDALVLEDYAAIMPLTWRSRAGIRYLYQPSFTQQGGIFAPGTISPLLVGAFLGQLGHHFRFAEIFLNFANPLSPPLPITPTTNPNIPALHPSPGATAALPPNVSAEARTNFILSLDQPYQQLAVQYKKDLVRNLRSAALPELNYGKEVDLREVLDGYRREYGSRLPHMKEEDYRRFERLCVDCREKGQLLIRVARDPQQQLLATALLLVDPAFRAIPGTPAKDVQTAPATQAPAAQTAPGTQAPAAQRTPAAQTAPAQPPSRMYLLQSTTTPTGKKIGANHFLLDGLVKEWAGNPLILDFEGSELPGIAHFYRNFGSINQPYFFYRYNKLPWPLRLLKK